MVSFRFQKHSYKFKFWGGRDGGQNFKQGQNIIYLQKVWGHYTPLGRLHTKPSY